MKNDCKKYNNQNYYSIKKKIHYVLFFTLYGTVKYLPSPLFDFLRAFVFKIFSQKCLSYRVKDSVTFWFPEKISIGRKVSINEYCFLDGYGGISIGDYTRIAHNCSIISEGHSYDDINIPMMYQKKIFDKVSIGKDVWLGCGVRVLQGVTIGNGTIVGAGSVVTKDLPENCIAVGVPAKVVKYRADYKSL